MAERLRLLGNQENTPNLRTKILDFRELDPSRISIKRNEIIMSIGNFPEILNQRISIRRMSIRSLKKCM